MAIGDLFDCISTIMQMLISLKQWGDSDHSLISLYLAAHSKANSGQVAGPTMTTNGLCLQLLKRPINHYAIAIMLTSIITYHVVVHL